MAPDQPVLRVARSFAFLDLCGFADYVDRFGDEAGLAEVTALRVEVRGAASRHGVRVDKWLGDGAMLVGVERGALLTAVLDIHRRFAACGAQLELRTGVAFGDVLIVEGDDYLGRAVNLASRLCDWAPAGQVVLAADARWKAPHGRRRTERIQVSGFATPVPILQIDPAAA